MPDSPRDLEGAPVHLLQQFLTFGDFPPGLFPPVRGVCGKPDVIARSCCVRSRERHWESLLQCLGVPPDGSAGRNFTGFRN